MERGAWLCVLGALVAACGGGGDSDSGQSGPSAAQGLYVGTTSNGRAATGLVLSDGTYYVLYSSVGSPSLIGGVFQGASSASGGTWSSTNGRDFNIEGL